jgi:hypothetical protein
MSSPRFDSFFSLTNEYRSIKYDLRNMQLLMDHLDNPAVISFRSGGGNKRQRFRSCFLGDDARRGSSRHRIW